MATYSYNSAGRRTGKTLENGVTTGYSYDAAKRLTGVSSPVAAYSYTLDGKGNRTSRAETTALGTKTDSYGYDLISQVITASYSSGGSVNYAYDAVGNRTSVNNGATNTLFSVNALNEYTQVGSLLVSSDSNGNLTSDEHGATYSYDAQNRLVSAQNGTNTLSVSYDARGRAVSRTINGVTTSYVYDGWNLVEEYDSTGAEQARYVYGPGSDEPLARISTNGTVYYHQDGNGNVVALSDSTGAVVERYTYDVYGVATITDGSGNTLSQSGVGNRFMFTGREYIAAIGIYDYRNRVYSATFGRFLQTDPIRFFAGDVNMYRYCGNDPGDWRDSNGGWPFGAIIGGIAGGVGVASSPGFSHLCPWQQAAELAAGIGSGVAVGLALPDAVPVVGGLAGLTGDLINQIIQNNGDFSKINYPELLGATLSGVLSGAFGAGLDALGAGIQGTILAGAAGIASSGVLTGIGHVSGEGGGDAEASPSGNTEKTNNQLPVIIIRKGIND